MLLVVVGSGVVLVTLARFVTCPSVALVALLMLTTMVSVAVAPADQAAYRARLTVARVARRSAPARHAQHVQSRRHHVCHRDVRRRAQPHVAHHDRKAHGRAGRPVLLPGHLCSSAQVRLVRVPPSSPWLTLFASACLSAGGDRHRPVAVTLPLTGTVNVKVS